MSARSSIKVKKLNGAITSSNYGCAQDVKGWYGSIEEYSYIPTSTTQIVWDKWLAYLIEMGIPLEVTGTRSQGNMTITLKDMSYIASGGHLLWLHSLIRLITEPETGFKNFIRYVYELRTRPELKEYDNYQIMQIALTFENRVTDDSGAYTHFMMATASNGGLIPIRLVKSKDVKTRFEVFYGELGLSETAIYGASTETVAKFVGKPHNISQSRSRTVPLIVGIDDYENHTKSDAVVKQNVSKHLPSVMDYFKKVSKMAVGSLVVCTNIGSHSTLIKGNMYKVRDLSANGKIVRITDAWGADIRTRHFKIIM